MPQFKDIYGKELSEMDSGEKEIALFSYLERIDNHLEILNGKTEKIPWLNKVAWGGTIIIPALFAWLAWLTKSFFGR